MDPQMETDIDHEVKDMKELLQKQLAWNSEKQRLYIFLIKITAAQNEVAISYRRLRGLSFVADIFAVSK